jgi:hypothetical protein
LSPYLSTNLAKKGVAMSLSSGLTVVVLIALAGCGGPKPTSGDSAGPQTVDAKSLIAAFKADGKAAKGKYEGKVLVVKGAKVAGHSEAAGIFSLMMEDALFSCEFPGAKAQRAKKLKTDSEPTVSFRGKLATTDHQADRTIFFFEDCELLD